MPDLIRFCQRVMGRLTTRRLFAFTPEYWGREQIEPQPMRTLQTRLSRIFGTRFFSRAYPGIVGRVHLHDNMLLNDSEEELRHYIRVGESAIRNIEESLRAAGRSFADVETCLDMACGYGRVLRLLQQQIDPRKITACEIEEEAVRFLAAEFGVRPLVSDFDLRKVNFSDTYDLIWVGSLFTHLPPAKGMDLLQILSGLLKPKGLLIFSTQGESCLSHIPFYGFMFKDREPHYREGVARQGFAYTNYYDKMPDYGIAVYARAYLEAAMRETLPDLRLVRYAERGWDDHQDIWAWQRVARPPRCRPVEL